MKTSCLGLEASLRQRFLDITLDCAESFRRVYPDPEYACPTDLRESAKPRDLHREGCGARRGGAEGRTQLFNAMIRNMTQEL
jgi:hypothetical protein